MWYYLIGSAFILSLSLSAVSVWAVMKLAKRWNIIDKPSDRKIHRQSKPLLGGVAIYFTFMVVILAYLIGLHLFQHQEWFIRYWGTFMHLLPQVQTALPKLFTILVGATIVFVLGIIDDIRGENFPYQWKFLGQFIAAFTLILGGVQTNFMPGNLLDYVITVCWVVGITNAFNLIDNMDGLATGVAAIATSLLVILTYQQAQFFNTFIFTVFLGSLLGFLPYNLYPSKIFIGDAGSMFIGFVLGVLTVTTSYVTSGSPTFVPVVMPLIILGVPIFDTLSVIIIRLREKRPIFVGDQNHFSHRLVKLGMRQSEAVVFIYIVSLCVGLGALMLPTAEIWECILILAQAVLVFGLITFLMHISKSRRLQQHMFKKPEKVDENSSSS